MHFKERKSPRMRGWDYGSEAAYFITICTRDRENFLGKIKNGIMQVSPAGAIAHVLWHEIKNHAKNVELGEFVVMPNHVHGILILKNDRNIVGIDPGRDVADIDHRVICRDVACNVPTNNVPNNNDHTTDALTTNTDITNARKTKIADNNAYKTKLTTSEPVISNPFKNERMAAISPKPNTVSTIIRSYKSAVTKYCNELKIPFAWQSRFHDHIIKNEESFQQISEYIKHNPSNWMEDIFY